MYKKDGEKEGGGHEEGREGGELCGLGKRVRDKSKRWMREGR